MAQREKQTKNANQEWKYELVTRKAEKKNFDFYHGQIFTY